MSVARAQTGAEGSRPVYPARISAVFLAAPLQSAEMYPKDARPARFALLCRAPRHGARIFRREENRGRSGNPFSFSNPREHRGSLDPGFVWRGSPLTPPSPVLLAAEDAGRISGWRERLALWELDLGATLRWHRGMKTFIIQRGRLFLLSFRSF